MLSSARWVSAVLTFARGAVPIFADVLTFLLLCFRSPAAVAAENLFLRKQLGLYIERKIKPRRATNSIRFTLAHLSRFFDWRNTLTVVQPDTLIRWHRSGFRVFWKWKSRPRGRPRVPADLQKLIVEMATNNPTWGEERIADELLLKNRSSNFSSDDSTLYSEAPSAPGGPGPALDDFRAQSHEGHHRHRLLCRCDSNVPVDLRVRDHGTRYEAHPSL